MVALRSLARANENIKLIASEGATPLLILLLVRGREEVKATAAALLHDIGK